MIPARFDYDVAESVEHAIELLAAGGGDTKLLAGGQSLIPALKLRIARPAKLVDLGRLTELAYVKDGGTHVAIGAMTRHSAVAADPLLAEHCPIVSHTAAQIGDPQVRHRGTIGGTLSHGDPASDMPAVMLALGAELVARGKGGERVIPATEFFTGVFETALAPDEVLVEVRVPKLAASTGWAYVKANRRAQDWATVGVAALVHSDNGKVAGASIGLVNMGGDAAPGSRRGGCARGRRVGGGRRRGRGGRHRAAERPRGVVRVPHAPRAGDRAPCARGGDGLSGREAARPPPRLETDRRRPSPAQDVLGTHVLVLDDEAVRQDERRHRADVLDRGGLAALEARVRLRRAHEVDRRARARAEHDAVDHARLADDADDVAGDLLRHERRSSSMRALSRPTIPSSGMISPSMSGVTPVCGSRSISTSFSMSQ